ncbi:Oidioi.mRNA.OKI2018_I69.PAR.g9723.t2.cds [Oikopleura dioica]|uniref:Oidioi.mRNA.OKI2018_I69.PAR.g9723.t2.cds n=1 Tax=Oikopleura dioica TaxID=34765 RepID=A0ABN7RM72_OIKDI|nr:Oidioi.mRNA.OKI2018_I69.PAR.g9723.t2.cds [Oikopleura dioica]
MNPNLNQSEIGFEEIKTEPFYWEKILPPVKKEPEKKTENIPCPICGKVFRKEFDIKRHLYTHTGEKPFKCEVCDRGFSQKSTLMVHMNLHTGAMPYSCHLCGKKFRQRQGLNCHLKQQRCVQQNAETDGYRFLTKKEMKESQLINQEQSEIQKSGLVLPDDLRLLPADKIMQLTLDTEYLDLGQQLKDLQRKFAQQGLCFPVIDELLTDLLPKSCSIAKMLEACEDAIKLATSNSEQLNNILIPQCPTEEAAPEIQTSPVPTTTSINPPPSTLINLGLPQPPPFPDLMNLPLQNSTVLEPHPFQIMLTNIHE